MLALRWLRANRGWTLAQAAEVAGVSVSFLSHVETGRSPLPPPRWERLAPHLTVGGPVPGREVWALAALAPPPEITVLRHKDGVAPTFNDAEQAEGACHWLHGFGLGWLAPVPYNPDLLGAHRPVGFYEQDEHVAKERAADMLEALASGLRTLPERS